MDFSQTQIVKTKHAVQKKGNPDHNTCPDRLKQSQLKKTIARLGGKQ